MTVLLAAACGPDQPCHPGHDPTLASGWPVWLLCAALAAWLVWLAVRTAR